MTTHTAIVPRTPVSIRVATAADLPFIDGLQKQHSKQLGYFPTKQFEDYIEGGHVLIAEAMGDGRWEMGDVQTAGAEKGAPDRDSGISISHLPSTLSHPTPVGYCISRDRYLKRDELGVIYQLCVSAGRQRGLIGAALVKEVFARSAYGCRLYCCWCAQDLEANYFWESLGFLPVAFRAGSTGKRRVHIFWQRRICEGDESTPYWYPFQTNSGAIREDRLVFPIPPGVHWRDVRAVAVPGECRHGDKETRRQGDLPAGGSLSPCLPVSSSGSQRRALPGTAVAQGSELSAQRARAKKPAKLFAPRGLSFAPPVPVAPVPEIASEVEQTEPKPRKRAKAPAKKIDPTYLAGARELRDRWLERVNREPDLLGAAGAGKYEVGRAEGLRIEASSSEVRLLSA